MSEPVGDQQNSQVETGTTETTNQNPAWNDILNSIPSQFHDQVTPKLREWDAGIQKQFGNIHDQYAPYKPIIDQGIDPAHIDLAMKMISALESNPEQTISTLQTYYGLTNQQAQQVVNQQQQNQPQTNQDFENADIDPVIKSQIQALKEQNERMAQILVENHQRESKAQEDIRLANEMKELHTSATQKYGYDFNEQMVLGLCMGANMTPSQAVEQFYKNAEEIASHYRKPAPNILGSGGSIPSGRTNTRNMTDSEVNNYVAQILRQSNDAT